MHAKDVAHQGEDQDLRVRLEDFNRVLKGDWAVTFDLKLLLISLTDDAALAHIDHARKQLFLLTVDHWKRMNWNKELITLAVDPHRIVIISVLIGSWSKLHVNVFGDTGG